MTPTQAPGAVPDHRIERPARPAGVDERAGVRLVERGEGGAVAVSRPRRLVVAAYMGKHKLILNA